MGCQIPRESEMGSMVMEGGVELPVLWAAHFHKSLVCGERRVFAVP